MFFLVIYVMSLENDRGLQWCSVRGKAETGQADGESKAEASQVKQASRDGSACRV